MHLNHLLRKRENRAKINKYEIILLNNNTHTKPTSSTSLSYIFMFVLVRFASFELKYNEIK